MRLEPSQLKEEADRADIGEKEPSLWPPSGIAHSYYPQTAPIYWQGPTPYYPCVKNIENGIRKDQVTIDYVDEWINLPPEIQEVKDRLWRNRELATEAGEEFPWCGTTYGLNSFVETRGDLTESPGISLFLRPTDYYSFLAVQEAFRKPVFKNLSGRPITAQEKYLSEYNPNTPVPLMAQSISANIVPIFQKSGREYALFVRRSTRKILATGKGVFALGINETPKRKPTMDERKRLEDVSEKFLDHDSLSQGNLIFNAIIRGAREELGIELPEESITLLAFGLNTNRYLYSFGGIARTDLTIDYVENCLPTARDGALEYENLFWVPFDPESVQDFLLKNRPWGETSPYVVFYALAHCFGVNRISRLFENFPLNSLL